MPNQLPPHIVRSAIDAAFAEDLGLTGDITTNATIPADAISSAVIAARQAGCIAGLPLAEAAFQAIDPTIEFFASAQDGAHIEAGSIIAKLNGNSRAILTAERVALNFLGHLSGIATHTRAFVDAIAGTPATICCTRKTTPGLRALEKYAVRMGGGVNHRFGLFDAILIKDNHVATAGGIAQAIAAAKRSAGHMVKIEVEVDTLDQLREALNTGADIVMLDNMQPDELKEAVRIVDKRVVLEASGGVSLATVRAIAESGVDLISVGALTHSSPVLDLGLDFVA